MRTPAGALFRTAIIWSGVFACVVLGLLWLSSGGPGFVWHLWEIEDWGADENTIEWILFYERYAAVRFREGWVEFGRHDEGGFSWNFNTRTRVHISIPLIILGATLGLMIWRDSRIPLKGHCRSCGYNLTGNVSGVCPECGEAWKAEAGAE